MQINPTEFRIEFVKHTIVAYAEFEFRTALQSFMREFLQPQAHLINFALYDLPNARRQVVE